MKYSRVVITCGVSAFGAQNAFRQWTESNGLLRFASGSSFPNPAPPEGKSETAALTCLEKALANRRDLRAVAADPKRISAEYSALNALRAERMLVERPTVVLIHTRTLGGKAAASILARVLGADFDATVECAECSMNVNDREQLRYDLGDFMEKVASALRDQDKHTTCFFPLGGYKVMTSLGCLAGGYFGFPTLYLHEEQQVFHEIPGVPWQLAPDALKRIAGVMTRAARCCEWAELSESEQGLIDEHSWLFERVDDTVAVNAFGLFLMQENAAIFSATITVSQEVDRAFQSDGRRPFVMQQLCVLSTKLASGGQDADLYHEREWSNLPKAEGWHLYKGVSHQQYLLRAIYRWTGDVLEVKRVWMSHDAYEREFLRDWTKDVGGWTEWSLA